MRDGIGSVNNSGAFYYYIKMTFLPLESSERQLENDENVQIDWLWVERSLKPSLCWRRCGVVDEEMVLFQ